MSEIKPPADSPANTEVDLPKITFPCENYPIRVMGVASHSFQKFVLDTFDKHCPGYDRASVRVKPSKAGKYESVLVFITATGTEQLSVLFEDLKTNPAVKMVL